MNLESENNNLRDKVKEVGGIRKLARELGIAYSSLWDKIKKEEQEERLSAFTSRPIFSPTKHSFPAPGEKTKTFLLTSAQDSSKISEPFFTNLKAFAEFNEAEILIGGYTYNKSLFEDHSKRSGLFHPELEPYMVWGQVELGELLFLAEMNTSPTATTPLSGFETYTKDKWGIFPHPKVQMLSIATHKEDKPKLLFTTGSVTEPNYVQKKAGIKAQFHHVLGAAVVELNDDNTYFVRHVIADDTGSFYDLDTFVSGGKVTTGHSVEAISYGDIHHEKLDPTVARTTWGYDVNSRTTSTAINLVDFLKPKFQFFHDLSDFDPRNHHNIGDIHFRYARHVQGNDNVETALTGCADFLKETYRPWSKSVVVQSNHDNALVTWLKNADYRTDPENALFFLETQTEYYTDLKAGIKTPKIFENTIRKLADLDGLDIVFNSEDQSFKICDDIECGQHGHLGANGSKASPKQFAKMGPRVIMGHSHTASIMDGVYINGVSGKLDMGYNKGPSSWSHSHTVVYPNGKRAILTMMHGRWFS
jgi:hypothetical protein